MHERSIRLLLLEDDPADEALVRRYLSRAEGVHFDVVCVRSLEAARRHTLAAFDVIVTDLGLADSSGLETVRSLALSAPAVPVVVLSGREDDGIRMEAMRLGAQEYLPKSASLRRGLVEGVLFAVERGAHLAHIRQLIEVNADGSVVVDDAGVVIYANRAAARLLDNESGNLVGQRFAYPATLGETDEIEIERHAAGKRVAELRTIRVDWGGVPARLVSLRDVTDERRNRELERRLAHADRLASVGQLAAGVAHEVNNPTTYIQANSRTIVAELEALKASIARAMGEGGIGLAEFTESHGLLGRIEELVALARENTDGVRRVTTIVRALSTFARIEQDELERFDPNDAVRTAATLTGNEVRHVANLSLELDDVPSIVGDRAKLTQVFVNLLVNAAHALEPERNDHTISVTSRVEDDVVCICVRDTGRGVPAADLQRIFEPFYTTKPRERGTGLGLSISAETVRKHGGRLEVKSEPGKGAEFCVYLPHRSERRPSVVPPRPPSSPPISRLRVLLIDDDASVGRALTRMLRRHDVVYAQGGEDAVRYLADDDAFDAVVCDLMMPGMGGEDVFAWMQQHTPRLVSRLGFVSGGVFSGRGREFVEREAVQVLEKPVSSADLESLIGELASS